LSSVEDVKTALANYEDILTIEEVGEVIKVQLKEFLHDEKGKAKWEAINMQVKEFGGQWKGGLGKNSHWAIPRGTPQRPSREEVKFLEKEPKQDLSLLGELEEIHDRLGELIKKVREAGTS